MADAQQQNPPRGGEHPREVTITEAEDFRDVAAQRIAAALRDAVAHDLPSVALAGGSTPAPVYESLAAIEPLPWPHVHVYFGDERCVPPDDPESNYAMARRTLLDRAPIPQQNVHRMPAERPDREAAAGEYAALLPPHLGVLILGIGEDGHTASLFPGSAAVDEAELLVLPIRGPKPPPWRLTITPPVIAATRTVIVLATGDRKSRAVAHALSADLSVRECPARLARRGIWILDRAAASVLDGGRRL